MEEAFSSLMYRLERLRVLLGSSRSDASPSPGDTPSSTKTNQDDVKTTSPESNAKGSSILWWLSSVAFGVSSALVYHWVQRETMIRRRRRLHPSQPGKKVHPEESSLDDDDDDENQDAWEKFIVRQISQWTRRQVRQLEQNLSQWSATELTLRFALGTSLCLPDPVTVPWVLGCLLVANSLWDRWDRSDGSSGSSRPTSLAIEKCPPYLFLCLCPARHRFQLWLTWTGLQVLGHPRNPPAQNGRRDFPPPPQISKDKPKEEAQDKTRLSKGNERPKPSTRYLEVMVHNVSHTDVILSLNPPSSTRDRSNDENPTSADDPYCLFRPRFSFMDVYCRVVLDALSGDEEVVEFPRYQRSEEDPRFAIKDTPMGVAPVGLGLHTDPLLMADMAQVRVRGRDLTKIDFEQETAPWPTSPKDNRSAPLKFPINYVFFPLLATLLPHWRTQIEERQYPHHVKRVLILVTGVGTPRNWTHSVSGNSTEVCAMLMEEFLKRIDPDLSVVRVHSRTNIFRYDDNLRFVDREFAPVMNAWRDAHARGLPYPDETGSSVVRSDNPFNADWLSSMSVTLSAADGSTARTHAIRESLRPFRPTFFHFWQLKTFWHETKIVDDDLEVHSYETMETVPAVDTERLRDQDVQLVVDEMKSFREDMMEVLRRGKSDIYKFWLRKTHKPVLAVLLVQSPGQPRPILYRGTNMEVSMPTGSLCAERNVIGTALASNPQLKREDLKLIAVLAIPTLEEVGEKPLRHIESSASIGSTTLESNPDRVADRQTSSVSDPDDWILPTDSYHKQHPHGLDQSFALVPPPSAEEQDPAEKAESTPVRKIRLFSKSTSRHTQRRSVVVQNSRDLNPLRPCGACNEWLKKIAESNPYFKIVTFTDAECHGVYCVPCRQ